SDLAPDRPDEDRRLRRLGGGAEPARPPRARGRLRAGMTGRDAHELGVRAAREVGEVLDRIPAGTAEDLCEEIERAARIACYGVGREGLMTRALCMRLMHLGLDAHVVGDMTTPPLGDGDLLLTSAGPGRFSTVLALLGVARDAEARTLVVTAQPDGEAPRQADVVIELPAQTMADDRGPAT